RPYRRPRLQRGGSGAGRHPGDGRRVRPRRSGRAEEEPVAPRGDGRAPPFHRRRHPARRDQGPARSAVATRQGDRRWHRAKLAVAFRSAPARTRARPLLHRGVLRGARGLRGRLGHRQRHALRPLADSLREDSALRLGTVVTEVMWRRGHVVVKARTRTGRDLAPFQAEKLIVTLPVGVLLARPGQDGAVRFDPPLKRKREALGWLRMGGVVKAVLRFREPVWAAKPVRKADFVHAPGAAFPTWWRTGSPDTPLVTGWAGGPAASKLGKSDPLPAALSSLARVLGRSASDLEGLLESANIVDWAQDPYSRGAYVYHLAEAPASTTADLAAPEEDTLYFAGEATSLTERSGTVDGAMESGLRAAKEALAKR
ncbi:MAG: FAD-dependent oxidoreductase, partial [Deltaproteobacteria bacterium]